MINTGFEMKLSSFIDLSQRKYSLPKNWVWRQDTEVGYVLEPYGWMLEIAVEYEQAVDRITLYFNTHERAYDTASSLFRILVKGMVMYDTEALELEYAVMNYIEQNGFKIDSGTQVVTTNALIINGYQQ